MNLKRLKYFVKIVDLRSLTKAAEALHIAQPALSQQLTILESETDQQLVVRSPRGISVTAAGQTLYRHAQTILRQCEDAQRDLSRGASGLGGRVTLGLAPGHVTTSLAYPLFSEVRARHPGVMLSLTEGVGAKLDEQVLSGRADIAVLYDNERERHGLNIYRIAREPLLLVGGEGPVAAEGTEISIGEMATLDLILPHAGHAIRQVVDEALVQRGGQPRLLAEIESPSILQEVLGDGLGLAVLAESQAAALAASTPGLRLWPICDPALTVAVSIYTSSYLPLSEQAKAILRLLLDLTPEAFRHYDPDAAAKEPVIAQRLEEARTAPVG